MFALKLNCGNAAFDNVGQEVARILREIADKVENAEYDSGKIMDANGNVVGSWKLTPGAQ